MVQFMNCTRVKVDTLLRDLVKGCRFKLTLLKHIRLKFELEYTEPVGNVDYCQDSKSGLTPYLAAV